MTSDGEYTFGWLRDFVQQVQVMLKTVGVVPLQVVAICMDRSPELIGSVLGCVVHGAVFMMLDSSLPNERIAKQIVFTKPRAGAHNERRKGRGGRSAKRPRT